ncbi:MAG TPA: hypothetical protein PLU85_06180 [Bacteroidia bacterium]|nr:hypothetical protein [Bacteroidia bacterium]QQR95933.1 MAG: hypothetical protein IPJ93_04325 [Bacteroidota bacterium]MBP7714675.1 hypothetical protein [Bacteroidia bacterium]HOZ83082.1 hypothetical protein [Bacteroidia bacterium]HOZ90627.1 hypothetical protein [Bacteroidia bacterium]
MKRFKILTIILVAAILPALAQNTQPPVVVPALISQGEVIPYQQLPEVIITPNAAEQKAVELPVVTITANKINEQIYPAVKYGNNYIASVTIAPINVVAHQQKRTFASLFSFLRYFSR